MARAVHRRAVAATSKPSGSLALFEWLGRGHVFDQRPGLLGRQAEKKFGEAGVSSIDSVCEGAAGSMMSLPSARSEPNVCGRVGLPRRQSVQPSRSPNVASLM
jgi:hypothetical protein